jgi:hypothetical protein
VSPDFWTSKPAPLLPPDPAAGSRSSRFNLAILALTRPKCAFVALFFCVLAYFRQTKIIQNNAHNLEWNYECCYLVFERFDFLNRRHRKVLRAPIQITTAISM